MPGDAHLTTTEQSASQVLQYLKHRITNAVVPSKNSSTAADSISLLATKNPEEPSTR